MLPVWAIKPCTTSTDAVATALCLRILAYIALPPVRHTDFVPVAPIFHLACSSFVAMPVIDAYRGTTIIFAIGVAAIALLWNSCSHCLSACPRTEPESARSGYLHCDCVGKPYQSSWGTWFHPERVWRQTGYDDPQRQRAGAVTPDWNILYHLGGVGPWVQKTINVVEGGIEVPAGCEVEQVHMAGCMMWL